MNPPERHLAAVPDLPDDGTDPVFDGSAFDGPFDKPHLPELDVPKQPTPAMARLMAEREAAELERRNPGSVEYVTTPRPRRKVKLAGPNAYAHMGPYRRNGMARKRHVLHPLSMVQLGVIHRRDQHARG